MAYTITRLPGRAVLVVRGQGEGHVGEAEEIIERLQALTTPAERAGILFDLRALQYIPSPAEGRYIGERYGQVGSAYGFRGVEARVFTDEAEALVWVGQTPASAAEAAGP